MIGCTDSHTSPATFEEDNYFGKATVAEPSAEPDRFQAGRRIYAAARRLRYTTSGTSGKGYCSSNGRPSAGQA